MFEDWNLVLAAYNVGENRVDRLIKRTGKKDFWELSTVRRGLPRETRNHVPLILSSIILARQPEKYGFPTDLDPPLEYDSIKLPKPIDLRAASKVLDISLSQLKKLNPSIRGNSTPYRYQQFELRIPPGTKALFQEQLASLPEVKLPPLSGVRHRVEPGDTFGHVALLYGVSVPRLVAANPRTSPRAMRIGSWIQIPSSTGRRATSSQKRTVQPGDRYQVRRGDTMGRIASMHGMSLAALRSANRHVDARSMQIGSWVQIPAASRNDSNKPAASRHRVRRGDTMGRIARRYGVSLAALQAANGRVKPKSMRIGSWITIPAPKSSE